MLDQKNRYVTIYNYATKYDLYKGVKDWSELSAKEQDDIIYAELTKNDINNEDLIMSTGLIKKQAQGLRSVIVSVSFLLERHDYINHVCDWSERQRHLILFFLKSTVLGLRLSQTFSSNEGCERSRLNGNELANLSGQELDDILDMDFHEAMEFLLDKLEKLSPSAGSIDDKHCSSNSEHVLDARRNNKVIHSYAVRCRMLWDEADQEGGDTETRTPYTIGRK